MLIPRQNTPEELDAFDAVCSRLAGFDERVGAEWADGYLTALVAGPRAIEPAEWLTAMCGDAFERAFADPADVAQAMAALTARTRVLADQLDPEWLLDDPNGMRLQPLVSMWDDDSRQQAVADGWISADDAGQLVSGALWAVGFFDAIDDFAADWRDPSDLVAVALKTDLLLQVQALMLPDGEELQAHLTHWHEGRALTRDELIDEACFAIQDLRVWWLDHAVKPTTRHVEPVPGRNDPCPCGSGRKYKKCHGQQA